MITPPKDPASPVIPPSNIQTQKPFVQWKTDLVAPPTPHYFQLNDSLDISLTSNTAGLQVVAAYRILTPQGEITEGAVNLIPTLASGGADTLIPFLEGWLLSLGLRITTPAPGNQWVYATVSYARGGLNAVARFGTLWEGYIYNNITRGIPNALPQNAIDGYGILRTIVGTTPAAGADINEVVTNNRKWTLLALTAGLTASATVANRQVQAVLDNGSHVFYGGPSLLNQTAGQSQTYVFFNAVSNAAVLAGGIPLAAPIPIDLKMGYRIRTNTSNIQAGDQWTAPTYLVRELELWDA